MMSTSKRSWAAHPFSPAYLTRKMILSINRARSPSPSMLESQSIGGHFARMLALALVAGLC